MSKLDYAIDILEDDLNELRQMQAVPKYAMDGKLYIDRTKSLHAAIEKLKKANEASKPDTKALAIESVSGSCLIGYLEWRDSLYKENRGGKIMYDVPGEHKWLDDDELFECWKKRNNYR
jgi:hypothetical protein